MSAILDDRPAGHDSVPGLRERKKQQTRQAIHEAAFRLIDEQGLEATTIEQICGAADVSTRTFFNYFPSKAAAALALPETVITEEVRSRFLSARGGLVWALCDVIGSRAEFNPDYTRIKALVGRRPELLTTLTGMMMEVRSQFVGLAAERSASQEDAELAVTLVMAALGRGIQDHDESTASLVTRLRETAEQLGGIARREMTDCRA